MARILFLASFLLLVAGVYPDLLPEDKKEDLGGDVDEPATTTPPVIVVTGVIREETTVGKVETTTAKVETTTPASTPGCITQGGKPGSCPNPNFRPRHHGHHDHGPRPKGKGFKKPKHDSSSEESVLSEWKPKFHSSSEESGSSERRQKNGGHHHHGKKGHRNLCKTPPCGEDGDCPDDLKCCLISRCGRRCVRPIPMLRGSNLGE
ncbi:XP_033029625.1uncharacterized protein LOC117061060 isoform X1 [Podarcis lilfordi]|uniref:XP_033029625.1uncharacterized protein LOC117061060 isoform X1 n=1 Tax=Podarcis lilfordi TaxID=74358 RepID=A0AA35LIA4_9SAUR|nr:XP_033029625.1uncharacterized protein LOC117061060 isoform X1 [Podarcis lilfordi]